MKIILCCMSGMSTSLLVNKLKVVTPPEVEIIAVSIEEGISSSKEADIILLGPQISFKENDLKEQVTIPVASIPMMMYGTMDVEGILNTIRTHLPNTNDLYIF